MRTLSRVRCRRRLGLSFHTSRLQIRIRLQSVITFLKTAAIPFEFARCWRFLEKGDCISQLTVVQRLRCSVLPLLLQRSDSFCWVVPRPLKRRAPQNPRKLCFSLLGNNRLRLSSGWSDPVCGGRLSRRSPTPSPGALVRQHPRY